MAREQRSTLGVLLLYMGGASTLRDIRPFLFRLFSDREILPLPSGVRIPLAWAISRIRYHLVKDAYRQIGGSPLLEITKRQAKALEESLAVEGIRAVVEVGMRYCPPFIHNAVENLEKRGVKKAVALPLYPQYSKATTGSCQLALREALKGRHLEVEVVSHWHTHPLFIQGWIQTIQQSLRDMPCTTHILFSAHSLPMRIVNQGDPYPSQVAETVEAIMEGLGPFPYSVAYQSKVGPVKWLGPSVEEKIARLSSEGTSSLALVPISFVSEHFETLYEMDIIFRKEAKRAGIKDFIRVGALNVHPLLIGAWKDIIMKVEHGQGNP